VDSLGKQGEDLAVRHLKALGYKILDRNYRCSLGEIDIVAKDKTALIFIEVKTRKSDKIAMPLESIGAKKQAKLKTLAEYYLQEKDYYECETRFDVISIIGDGLNVKIEHITDAF
jgi:putative endonuclease